MFPVIAAVAIGGVFGALRRPHGRHLTTPRLYAPWLLIAGVALQIGLAFADFGSEGGLLGLSLFVIGAFCVTNRHFVGMGVIAVGVFCNVVVIGLNGAMPVRVTALVNSDAVAADALIDTDLGAGRRFERTDDIVPWLGDAIPVAPFQAAMSYGDLIVLAGTAALAGDLVRLSRRGQKRFVIPDF